MTARRARPEKVQCSGEGCDQSMPAKKIMRLTDLAIGCTSCQDKVIKILRAPANPTRGKRGAR